MWALTAVLSGVLVATYVRHWSGVSSAPARAGILATAGSVLALGCPVCNKLLVTAIEVSEVLNVWASIQPLIAVAGLTLLGWALSDGNALMPGGRSRRAIGACNRGASRCGA